MVEFSIGFDNYLMKHEWNFYVFEAAPIFPVVVIFCVFHPARYLNNVNFRLASQSQKDDRSREEDEVELNGTQRALATSLLNRNVGLHNSWHG